MLSHFPSLSSDFLEVSSDVLEGITLAQSQRDHIYEMAKANNKLGLEQYVKDGGSVDVMFAGKTAAMILASEGAEEAVALLVNQFNANRNYALLGASIGTQHENELMEILIDTGGETNYAIQGAAENNDVEMVKLLIANGGSLIDAIESAARKNNHQLVDSLVQTVNKITYDSRAPKFTVKPKTVLLCKIRGYAYAGNQDKVNELLIECLHHTDAFYQAAVSAAVSGAALSHRLTWMYQLLANHPESSHRDAAVRVLAMNGETELVMALIAQGASRDCAAEGAAFGGHANLLQQLIKDGANANQAVSWAAQGGQYQLTLRLIKEGASLEHAVIGAAQSVHLDLLNCLVSMIRKSLTDDVAEPIISKVKNCLFQHLESMMYSYQRRNQTLGYKVDVDAIQLRLITFLNDHALRHALQNPVIVERRPNSRLNRLNRSFKKLKELVIDNAADSPKMIKLKNVSQVNRIMLVHQLPLNDAVAFKTISLDAHVWFLIGPRLVNEGILAPEIFLLISSFLLQRDYQSTKSLFILHNRIMPAHLFAQGQQWLEQKKGNNNSYDDTSEKLLMEERFKQRLLTFK